MDFKNLSAWMRVSSSGRQITADSNTSNWANSPGFLIVIFHLNIPGGKQDLQEGLIRRTVALLSLYS